MRSLALAIAMLAGAANAAESLKGLELGTAYGAFTDKFASANCSTDGALSLCYFDAFDDFLEIRPGWRATGGQAEFIDGKLYRVFLTFVSDGYDEVVELGARKFGKPPSKAGEAVQNRFGAKFRNEQATWVRSGAVFQVTRYAGSLETSTMTLFDKAQDARAQRVERLQRTASAPGL